MAFLLSKSIMKRLKEILIRSSRDSRECPYCHKTFIPVDATANNAFLMYVYMELFENERRKTKTPTRPEISCQSD